MPGMPGSFGQRRFSPVSVPAPGAEPWNERYAVITLCRPRQRARELDRVFVRFAAAGGEEDASALRPRRDLDDRASQLGALVVCQTRGDVRDALRLVGDRRRDDGMRVPEIDRDESRRKIDIALATVVVESRSLRRARSREDCDRSAQPTASARNARATRQRRRERSWAVLILVTSFAMTIKPPATLSAKKTMKTQTPKRFQKSRRARTTLRLMRDLSSLHDPCAFLSAVSP